MDVILLCFEIFCLIYASNVYTSVMLFTVKSEGNRVIPASRFGNE